MTQTARERGTKAHKTFCIRLARRAGIIMRKNFRLNMKKEWKSDDSPVTATDIAINKMVIAEVRKSYPGHAVLAEEESMPRKGARFVWVCDPVDGTVPFSHGIPTCVFSLALCDDGVPVVGVVYDPFLDRMFYAEKGKGATMNGERIRVSSAEKFENVVVSVYPKQVFFDGEAVVRALSGKTFNMQVWSIIYTGVLVAAGDIVATVHHGMKAHDAATVKIIVEEAGGTMTDIDGKEQRYDRAIKGFVASNGLLHDQLLALIKKNRK